MVMANGRSGWRDHALESRHLLPGEDRVVWPDGLVVLGARGARVSIYRARERRVADFYDLVCGYGAFNFGHGNRRIRRALVRELDVLDGSGALPSPAAAALASRLVGLCGFADGRCYFTVGGSQAVEIAMRVGRLLSGRPRVAVVSAGFHGYGGETIHLSRDFVPAQKHLESLAGRQDVVYLPWNDGEAIRELGRKAGTVGTLVVEPVLGAGGFRVPDRAWFRKLLRRAREIGAVTVMDEIQVGMGRTGRVLASEHFLDAGAERRDLVDVVTLSKSLAGGLYPLAAVVVNSRWFDDRRRGGRASAAAARRRASAPGPAPAAVGGPDQLNEAASLGETFSNNPAGCAAAHAALDLLEERKGAILRKVRRKGEWLLAKLRRTLRRRRVGDVRARGTGLALALDFPSKEDARRFAAACFDQRLLCYVSGGRIYATVKLVPPLTVKWRELGRIRKGLKRALKRWNRDRTAAEGRRRAVRARDRSKRDGPGAGRAARRGGRPRP
jgi:acetylornithine/succinyldiaminopimelate/putrescine aminotransferase